MTRESDDARWLREMVTDYRLDADNTVASRRIAINELIHSQRETIARLEERITSFELGKRMYDAATQIREDQIAQLQARLTASEAAKKWTTERPTKAGWYWFSTQAAIKESIQVEPEIVNVQPHDGELCIKLDEDLYWPVTKYSEEYEWQGPLTPGEE